MGLMLFFGCSFVFTVKLSISVQDYIEKKVTKIPTTHTHTYCNLKWNVIFKRDQMKIHFRWNSSKNTKGWNGWKKNLENCPTRMKCYHISSILAHSFEKYRTVWLQSISTLSPLVTHTHMHVQCWVTRSFTLCQNQRQRERDKKVTIRITRQIFWWQQSKLQTWTLCTMHTKEVINIRAKPKLIRTQLECHCSSISFFYLKQPK